MEKSNTRSNDEAEYLDYRDEIAETKSKYRKVTQAAIAKWVKDFQAGTIRIETVDDLKKLIELDIDLQREEL